MRDEGDKKDEQSRFAQRIGSMRVQNNHQIEDLFLAHSSICEREKVVFISYLGE